MKDFQISIRNLYQTSRSSKIGTITWWFLAFAFIVCASLMALFVWLVEEVADGDTLMIDEAILQWFYRLHTPSLDRFISVMTDAGGTVGVVIIVSTLLSLLSWRRKRRAALQLSLGVAGAVGINLILKNIFTRVRPDLWESIISETSYSFPSGHAMASSALAFSVVLIFWKTRYRWWMVALATLYMVFVGASRLYLGVHYPTDVLGGWAMSGLWVLVIAILLGAVRVKSTSRAR